MDRLTRGWGGEGAGALVDPTVMHADDQKTSTSLRIGGGNQYKAGGAVEYYFGPVAYPWVAPYSGTIADLTIKVTEASAGRSVFVGIYSTSETTGLPETKIADAEFSVASAAIVTQTSFTGTPTVERGTLYWIMQVSDDVAGGGGGQVGGRDDSNSYAPPSNICCGLDSALYFGDDLPNAINLLGETELPATVTASDCQGIRRNLIDVIVGW